MLYIKISLVVVSYFIWHIDSQFLDNQDINHQKTSSSRLGNVPPRQLGGTETNKMRQEKLVGSVGFLPKTFWDKRGGFIGHFSIQVPLASSKAQKGTTAKCELYETIAKMCVRVHDSDQCCGLWI